MNVNKQIIKFCLFTLIFASLIGCSGQTSSFNSANLDEWCGDYFFSEFCPPNINMLYGITIFREERDYYGDVYIDGFQTLKRLRTIISGDEKSINLIFKDFLPDSINYDFEPYNDGVLVLSLKRDNSEILTIWGSLIPIIPENEKEGIYFLKTVVD